MMIRIVASILSLFFFPSCNKVQLFFVDPVFIEYLSIFENEARLRGFEYTAALKEINVAFTEFNKGVAGQCQKSGNVHSILIDSISWRTASSYEKEELLFHELGHCILNRSHLDEKSWSGVCNSIMRSSASVCRLNYHTSTRSFYLNELFGS